MRIIVLFNLRQDVSVADYETWAKTRDIPIVNGLQSVESFTVHKATGILGSERPSPYQYIEVLDVADDDMFGREVSTETMKRIASEFQALADNPTFIATTAIEA